MTTADLTPETLDPAVVRVLEQARAHILTHTLTGLPAATVTRACLHPTVQKAVARVNAMADSGDVLATRQACQAWNRALRAAVQL